jgi:iron(III)-enterobactin esterase
MNDSIRLLALFAASVGLVVSCSDSGGGAVAGGAAAGATATGGASAGAVSLPTSGTSGALLVAGASGATSGAGSDSGAAAGGNLGSGAMSGLGGMSGASAGIGGAPGGAVVVSPKPDGKETINGPYSAPPEATRQAGAPQSTLDHFVFNTSHVFPGTSRSVNVFIPAQYKAGAAVPFMVIQDGDEQIQSFKTNVVLENLIFQKRLPVMAALFVHNPDNFGPVRSLEYDCLDDDYYQFITTEIIPAVKSRHPELVLTDDPNGRGALGKSSGGPASFTLAWRHPEAFRRVLTLNGSFVNLCKNGAGANSYPDLIRKTDPAAPLRVYMFSGSMDNGGFAAGNQALADAFETKGYAWRYVYGVGVGHANNFGASQMTEALLWCWAGYPL